MANADALSGSSWVDDANVEELNDRFDSSVGGLDGIKKLGSNMEDQDVFECKSDEEGIRSSFEGGLRTRTPLGAKFLKDADEAEINKGKLLSNYQLNFLEEIRGTVRDGADILTSSWCGDLADNPTSALCGNRTILSTNRYLSSRTFAGVLLILLIMRCAWFAYNRSKISDGEEALAAGVDFISDTKDKAQEILKRVLNDVWKQTHFHHLPEWLKDNDFLHGGHRPQIPSFKECFKSIFRIHSETGNIWTHLLGCIFFIANAAYFLMWKDSSPFRDKWVFATFFAGAVLCLGFSFLFHTVYCHSRSVGKLFGKLDYCGISLLILGSFVPWLHFGFYCKSIPKFIYIGVISVLAISAIVVSLWDKFSEPEYRAIRAGVFLALGLSGVIPALHYVIAEGWIKSVQEGSMLWLVFMGVLYVAGAGLYACRVPERWYPGRFDIWFQSHQIFHVLVVVAALVHYHGISLMADHRISLGECPQMSASESATCAAE